VFLPLLTTVIPTIRHYDEKVTLNLQHMFYGVVGQGAIGL
jgi:hypothetical protein